jgi:hypothetical protein
MEHACNLSASISPQKVEDLSNLDIFGGCRCFRVFGAHTLQVFEKYKLMRFGAYKTGGGPL